MACAGATQARWRATRKGSRNKRRCPPHRRKRIRRRVAGRSATEAAQTLPQAPAATKQRPAKQPSKTSTPEAPFRPRSQGEATPPSLRCLDRRHCVRLRALPRRTRLNRQGWSMGFWALGAAVGQVKRSGSSAASGPASSIGVDLYFSFSFSAALVLEPNQAL
jgi:hypothetical protein